MEGERASEEYQKELRQVLHTLEEELDVPGLADVLAGMVGEVAEKELAKALAFTVLGNDFRTFFYVTAYDDFGPAYNDEEEPGSKYLRLKYICRELGHFFHDSQSHITCHYRLFNTGEVTSLITPDIVEVRLRSYFEGMSEFFGCNYMPPDTETLATTIVYPEILCPPIPCIEE